MVFAAGGGGGAVLELPPPPPPQPRRERAEAANKPVGHLAGAGTWIFMGTSGAQAGTCAGILVLIRDRDRSGLEIPAAPVPLAPEA
jgi:hypothetical protein